MCSLSLCPLGHRDRQISIFNNNLQKINYDSCHLWMIIVIILWAGRLKLGLPQKIYGSRSDATYIHQIPAALTRSSVHLIGDRSPERLPVRFVVSHTHTYIYLITLFNSCKVDIVVTLIGYKYPIRNLKKYQTQQYQSITIFIVCKTTIMSM